MNQWFVRRELRSYDEKNIAGGTDQQIRKTKLQTIFFQIYIDWYSLQFFAISSFRDLPTLYK